MGASTIPVDLLNPGQVFACLGLMEAVEVLCGPCEGVFEQQAGETLSVFRFETAQASDPLETVVSFLERAEVRALAPHGSGLRAKEPGVATEELGGTSYPCKPPDTPSALPVLIRHGDRTMRIEHWADGSSRDTVKFWAGAGGYSGAALTRDALCAIGGLSDDFRQAARQAPFGIEAPMSSSFRFDWRRDYVPMDVGFSPNSHAQLTMVGYPFVEILAAIGLQHARPSRVSPRDKLRYRYGVSTVRLPTTFVRVVLGAQPFGFPFRRFVMRLDWPGKEGQARCIVDAHEESLNE